MRVLMQARLGTQHTTDALRSNKMGGIIDQTLSATKAEAAFFGTDPSTGQRCAYIVCDLADPSQLPSLLEPLFSECHANITITPVMNQSELIKGLQNLKW